MFACVLRDITKRKEIEGQLQKLSQAVEQSPVSVVITSHDGTIEYVNPRFVEMTGYTLDESVGQNPRILKTGVHDDDFYENLWKTILAGNLWQGEICNRKKNGETYWEHALIAPVRGAMGEITHFVAIKEDITESRRAAEELRTAKEDAEAANRAKSDFSPTCRTELPDAAQLRHRLFRGPEEGVLREAQREAVRISWATSRRAGSACSA